ncbi:hypothetical protein A2957_03230 [Candidatus Roizmanbacteria bacterium RIFCSPLOWO2_01_FULL_38_11]|uniref:Phosphoglycerate mutase n=1 Tax=Candidatus Roizmanbacteria bacterium RIFCSPLOWO2_01_FULL_38_11 TaxID=1802060 RepID=A0A1F7ILF6_9BACT|nr:MAG: hypothetical protein A2957_03230 [Candidatus Roizmanbacteria bacterium RIFCSPLOWO2_01_FULL_38_11]
MKKDLNCVMYIARHGETDWNMKKLLMGGGSDIPLNQNGEQQAKELSEHLDDIHFDAIFSSSLERATKTAEYVALKRKLAVKTTEALKERRFGPYEGKHYSVLNNELKDTLEKFDELPDEEKFSFKLHDGIESDEELEARVITYLREVSVAYQGKTVLILCHGAIMRFLLWKFGMGTYKQLDYDVVEIHNTAYIKVRSDGVDFFVDDVYRIEGLPEWRSLKSSKHVVV